MTLPTKVCLVKAIVSPVVMYGCESWTIRRLSTEELILSKCGVGEDSWESLGHQRVKLVSCKGNQPWIFIGRTEAEAKAPLLWPPDAKSQLIRKDPDAGKDWGQEEMGTTEDEMVGCHHWVNGQEFEQTPGDGGGQGSLACCSPWGRKESDTTEWLNNKNIPTNTPKASLKAAAFKCPYVICSLSDLSLLNTFLSLPHYKIFPLNSPSKLIMGFLGSASGKEPAC